MSQLAYAGMGWANGAITGGNSRILSLPSDDLLILGSEHWHHDEAVRAGKRVLFRGMARQGFRPAELGWDVKRYVDEILRDAVRVSESITDFVGWNELNLQDERGDQRSDFGDLTGLFTLLGGFQLAVLTELRKRPATKRARLHFGAFAPKDETDYTDLWRAAAELADCIDVHAYGPGPGIVGHIAKYRTLFPGATIQLTEWHSNEEGPEQDRNTLELLANEARERSSFRAYYFLWRWDNPPEHQRDLADAIVVEGNADRLALFRDPPHAAEEPVDPKPATDPYEHFALAQIVSATQCPEPAVAEHWPRLVGQLVLCGINDKMVQAALIGTVAIESASTFKPVREAFWLDEDWRREHLRYYPFYGRGFIQITWEANYRTYGDKVNELWNAGGAVDLIARPDDALDPDVSAAVSALYFRDHGREDGSGIPEAARAGDWREVRRLVQGADAGLDRLVAVVAALGVTAPVEPTERTYGPDIPDSVIFQQNAWTCAVRSTYAALWAMAEQGQGEPVTYGDGGTRDVYAWLVPQWDKPDTGLLDHTGAGLAEALRAHGYDAKHYYAISLEAVRDVAGAMPVLLGGDAWNHWVYVRGRTNDGGLVLENPSPGHAGISDYLRDSFDRLGPMAAVVIDLAPVVEPSTYAVGPGILAKMAEAGDRPATDEAYFGQEYSEAFGMSGSRYVYLKVTNTTYRFDPAA